MDYRDLLELAKKHPNFCSINQPNNRYEAYVASTWLGYKNNKGTVKNADSSKKDNNR